MLSPHITSAFAQERQTRYRREAETQRLVRRPARIARDPARATRTSTPAPPVRVGGCVGAPSPAH